MAGEVFSAKFVLIGIIVAIVPDLRCERQWEMVHGGPRMRGAETLTHMEYDKSGSKNPETEKDSKNILDDNLTPDGRLSLNKTQTDDTNVNVPEETIEILSGGGEIYKTETNSHDVKIPSESGKTEVKESKSEELNTDEIKNNVDDNNTDDRNDNSGDGSDVDNDDEGHDGGDNIYHVKIPLKTDINISKNEEVNNSNDNDNDGDTILVYSPDVDGDDDDDDDGEYEYIDGGDHQDHDFDDNGDDEDDLNDNDNICVSESNATSVLPLNKTQSNSIDTVAIFPENTVGSPLGSRETVQKPITNMHDVKITLEDGNIDIKKKEIDNLGNKNKREEKNTQENKNNDDDDHSGDDEEAHTFSIQDSEDNVNNSTENDETTEYYSGDGSKKYSDEDDDRGSGEEDINEKEESEDQKDHIEKSEKINNQSETNIQNEKHLSRVKRETKNVYKIAPNPRDDDKDHQSKSRIFQVDDGHPNLLRLKESISKVINEELGSGDFSDLEFKLSKDESTDLNSGVDPEPPEDDNRSDEAVPDDNSWVKYFNKPRRIVNA